MIEPKDLGDYLAYLKDIRGRAPTTLRSYRFDLVSLLRVTGGEFSKEALYRWRVELSARKPATVNRAINAAAGFTRWLAREGRLPSDPLDGEERPKTSPPNPQAIPEADMKRMLYTAKPTERERNWRVFRNHAMLELAYASGLRASELVNLDLADIDLEQKMLVVHNGKGGKHRVVPFRAAAAGAIAEWLSRRPRSEVPASCKALFVSHRKRRISTEQLSVVCKQAATAAGIDPAGVHPHIFRHSCFTDLINHGCSIEVVSKIAGHASYNTTVGSYWQADTGKMSEEYQKIFGR